jgi:RsiW-degrading membrane proteinase PrsW (M82 family)
MLMLRIFVSIIPVFVFLAGLVCLDSFKLVRLRSIVQTILMGCGAALVAMLVCSRLQGFLGIGAAPYARFVAPLLEEILKALPVAYLITRKRVGFLVDAAIFGFAVGAGFAFVENVYYLRELESSNLSIWIIRGFGTAVLHGGTTAVFAVISKSLSDRHAPARFRIWDFLPGLLIAVAVHSLFNHFFLPPLIHTVTQLVAMPALVMLTFSRSERMLRDWLEVGLDSDVRMLDYITTGTVSETRIGRYLHLLRSRFPGEVVADMLCLLRIHLELGVRAKGVLLMREAGFPVPYDPEIEERLTELRFLEKSIGKTGRLALSPVLHTSSRALWQIHLLRNR